MAFAVQIPAYEYEGREMPAQWLRTPGWKAKHEPWKTGNFKRPLFVHWQSDAKTWVSREAAQRNADVLDTTPAAVVVEVTS